MEKKKESQNEPKSEEDLRWQSEAKVNPPVDPFGDLGKLRLSQNFEQSLGVKRKIVQVPVRKPSRENWVRVHADEEYRLQTAVIELKEDREIYLIDPGLWPSLASEATFGPRLLLTSISRQGVLFLWPIRLPGADGKVDSWNQSALEAANLAEKAWVRVTANMALGGYDVYEATGELADPEWPEISFAEILRIAFKDHFIDTADHPVLKKLRGEV